MTFLDADREIAPDPTDSAKIQGAGRGFSTAAVPVASRTRRSGQGRAGAGPEPPRRLEARGSPATPATKFRTRCNRDRLAAMDFGMRREGTARPRIPAVPENGGGSSRRCLRAQNPCIRGEQISLPLNVRISTYRLRHPQGLATDSIIRNHAMRKYPNFIWTRNVGNSVSATI